MEMEMDMLTARCVFPKFFWRWWWFAAERGVPGSISDRLHNHHEDTDRGQPESPRSFCFPEGAAELSRPPLFRLPDAVTVRLECGTVTILPQKKRRNRYARCDES